MPQGVAIKKYLAALNSLKGPLDDTTCLYWGIVNPNAYHMTILNI